MSHALVYAAPIALSPVAIAASVLLLSCSGGVAKATAFAVGWLAGLAAVVTVLTVLVREAGVSDADPVWLSLPNVALGLAFLVSGAVFWLRRGRPVEQPRWLTAVDSLTPRGSGGLGIVASANPKALALALAAALALAQARASAPESAAALGLFAAIGTLGVALPVGVHAASPARTDRTLQALRSWLARHDHTVLALLGVLLGVIFLADGISGL